MKNAGQDDGNVHICSLHEKGLLDKLTRQNLLEIFNLNL